MFTFAAVFCAISVNAASILWNSDVIQTPDGKATASSGARYVTAAAYDIGATLYATLGDDMGKMVSSFKAGDFGTALKTGGSNGTGKANLSLSTTAYAAGDNLYSAVVYTYGDKYVINTFSSTIGADGTLTLDNGATKLHGTGTTLDASSWTSGSSPVDPSGTPEPTSGLLLLIGGAMLALRRKQK